MRRRQQTDCRNTPASHLDNFLDDRIVICQQHLTSGAASGAESSNNTSPIQEPTMSYVTLNQAIYMHHYCLLLKSPGIYLSER